jgi:sulfite exporter TauE/SafE
MDDQFRILLLTAVSVGFLHTLLGPDHYLPFLFFARSLRWSRTKTLWITFLCGIGHVLSSVALGALGIALGLGLAYLKLIESVRGDVAAYLLIAFGLVYGAWGLRRALRNRPHTHTHLHPDGAVHAHFHTHHEEHMHVHGAPEKVTSLTPWVLFTIFVFGPCETLIPLLMYPAARRSIMGMVAVVTAFTIATVGTMLVTVTLVLSGIERIPLGKIERYSHALAGGALALCGVTIRFAGL